MGHRGDQARESPTATMKDTWLSGGRSDRRPGGPAFGVCRPSPRAPGGRAPTLDAPILAGRRSGDTCTRISTRRYSRAAAIAALRSTACACRAARPTRCSRQRRVRCSRRARALWPCKQGWHWESPCSRRRVCPPIGETPPCLSDDDRSCRTAARHERLSSPSRATIAPRTERETAVPDQFVDVGTNHPENVTFGIDPVIAV